MALSKIDPDGLNVGQIGGRRNLIINGAMQVAQRGTSFTGLTNGSSGYNLDRWEWRESATTSSVWTVSQDTDTPNGFGYSIKAIATTGASTASGNLNRFRQRIEAQNLQGLAYGTSDAKQITVSFWVKSNKTGTANVTLYADDADDLYANSYTINTADTWEYKTLTYSGNTSGSINNDNGLGFYVDFIYAAGSAFSTGTGGSWANYNSANYAAGQTLEVGTATNDYFQITGVQLEVGDTATPFEHRSYGEELALCQRYYWRMDGRGFLTMASKYTTNQIYCGFSLPVSMRSQPTFASASGTNYYRFYADADNEYFNDWSGTQGVQEGSLDKVMIYDVDTAHQIATNGQSGWVQLFDTSAYVAFNAEL